VGSVADSLLAVKRAGAPEPFSKITRNAVRCLKCNDVIESKHRHDFVRCECGAIAVDGGQAYLKRSGDLNGYEDLSESEEV
jgi:tRNA(Ile2) C34 agmatinyltransferase TiaS